MIFQEHFRNYNILNIYLFMKFCRYKLRHFYNNHSNNEKLRRSTWCWYRVFKRSSLTNLRNAQYIATISSIRSVYYANDPTNFCVLRTRVHDIVRRKSPPSPQEGSYIFRNLLPRNPITGREVTRWSTKRTDRLADPVEAPLVSLKHSFAATIVLSYS